MEIGLLLSVASAQAAAAAAVGPSPRFPFGRDAITPLVVLIQGLAIAGTFSTRPAMQSSSSSPVDRQ